MFFQSTNNSRKVQGVYKVRHEAFFWNSSRNTAQCNTGGRLGPLEEVQKTLHLLASHWVSSQYTKLTVLNVKLTD